jgi:hypothetical protein
MKKIPHSMAGNCHHNRLIVDFGHNQNKIPNVTASLTHSRMKFHVLTSSLPKLPNCRVSSEDALHA